MSRRRKYTSDVVRKLREWKSLTQLCRELGVNRKSAHDIRRRQYKVPEPQP